MTVLNTKPQKIMVQDIRALKHRLSNHAINKSSGMQSAGY